MRACAALARLLAQANACRSRAPAREPGDLIAAGTPAGIGALRDPPAWLQPGDRIRMEVSRIGVLGHEIVEPTAGADSTAITEEGATPWIFSRRGLIAALGIAAAAATSVAPAHAQQDFPNVQTMAAGGFQGFEEYVGPVDFLAPAGTPQPVLDKLGQALQASVRNPATQEKLRALGAVVVGSTPEQYAKWLKEDQARWAKLVKDADVKAQ